MHFIDAVSVVGTRMTGDGFLIANAKSVRTGVQLYAGTEVGMTDKAIVRVYRPPEEVFAQNSLQSFSHAPITIDHPAEPVTAQNWRRLSVGEVSTAAQMDGEWVSLPLILKDAIAIDGVASGKRQLSAGYVCKLDKTPGQTPDGEQYDAVQREIRINHLALVDRARAGPRACIGDAWPTDGARGPDQQGEPRDPQQQRIAAPMTLKTHTIGDHAVEMSDAAIVAVKGLQKELGTLTADNLKLTADAAKAAEAHAEAIRAKDAAHADALKVKDTELATKDAEIEKLKVTQVDDAKLDALAMARADVIGKAKAIVGDVKTEGVAIPAIRRAVVSAKLGDAAIKDKSDDYVEARFDLLADAAPNRPDPLSRALADARPNSGAEDPHAKRRQQLQDAWKPAA